MAWQFISKLEIHDRQVHSSPDGTEVINTYYVEPASAGCVVTSALLGAVLYSAGPGGPAGLNSGGVPNNPTLGHRILPARDYQYQNCYCVDAFETMSHPMQAVGTASLLTSVEGVIEIGVDNEWDSIRNIVQNPIVLNGPQSLNDNFTANSPDPTQGPRPGVYIRAVFRPLVTNYVYNNPIDTRYSDLDQAGFPFDYIDIRLNPMSRIIPASSALYGAVNSGGGFGIAAQGAAEQVDSWIQITIRRVMCPNIPVQTISVLRNKLNGWRGKYGNGVPIGYTPTCFEVPGLNLSIPITKQSISNDKELDVVGLLQTSDTFPLETFRFDDAIWEKKVIQSCIDQNASTVDPSGNINIVILTDPNGIPQTAPMTWYNGELAFSWRTVLDNWYPVTYIPNNNTLAPNPNLNPPDYVGNRLPKYGWVPWNCDWLPGGVAISFSTLIPTPVRYPTGWYELSSWQATALHGDLFPYNYPNGFGAVRIPLIGQQTAGLGEVYLQRKYWGDTDIRLRGGTTSNWSIPDNKWLNIVPVNANGDMLPGLATNLLSGCTPMDLLFRIDSP